MKYGFIGCGNMGGTIARALVTKTTDFAITDRSGRAAALAESLSCHYLSCNEIVQSCDRIFLGVKPQNIDEVLTPLRPLLQQRHPLLISMVAGVSMQQLETMVGTPLPIVRIMPNTPVAVGHGMILYCKNALVNESVLADLLWDLSASGRLDAVPETLFDAAGTVSGCGPAYAYLFLEAMADGAVACGVPRDQALEYAAATLSGAAQMVLQTGAHPGALKDDVCSPGGSTIAGVKVLEDSAFRSAVINAVIASYRRTSQLAHP